MSFIKSIVAAGVVVLSSQGYHAYRRHREHELKETWKSTVDRGAFLKQIHEEKAELYDKEMDNYEWAKRIDKYRKVMCSYAEGKVLEVGIGTGRNWDFYPKSARVVGVDWSPKMLEFASNKKKPVRESLLMQMDGTKLDFPDSTFDTVLASFTLSSSHAPQQMLREMARVCKPGGSILILDRGRGHGILTNINIDMYRYQYLFELGYDQGMDIGSLIENAPATISTEERKQGGHIYFYILKPKK